MRNRTSATLLANPYSSGALVRSRVACQPRVSRRGCMVYLIRSPEQGHRPVDGFNAAGQSRTTNYQPSSSSMRSRVCSEAASTSHTSEYWLTAKCKHIVPYFLVWWFITAAFVLGRGAAMRPARGPTHAKTQHFGSISRSGDAS